MCMKGRLSVERILCRAEVMEVSSPTVQSLLSWDYVHHVGPNELGIL